jgi:integrase
MDLDTLLARFEAEYCAPNSISLKRRHDSAATLTRLADGLDHDLDLLTAAELATFIGAELSRGLKPQTVLTYQRQIRSFITWATAAGVIDPERSVQLKSVPNPRGSAAKNLPRPYTAAQIREFRTLLAEQYPVIGDMGRGSRRLKWFLGGRRAAGLRGPVWRHARRLQFEAQVALALEQGLRVCEIGSLSLPALDPTNDDLVVLTAKQGPGREVKRAIPYASHARTVVREWLDFRQLLAPGHDHPWLQLGPARDADAQLMPQSYDTLQGSMTKCFGSPWSWHRFRHTACTEWLRSGVPLEKVRVYAGHANIEMTLAYTQLLKADISEAFAKAEEDFARRLGLAA